MPRLLALGFQERRIVPSARVLGIDFTARLGSADRPTQNSRIAQASRRLDRIAMLPVSNHLKAKFVASLAIPKASWGAWVSLVPTKKLVTKAKHVSGGGHCEASPELFFLLRGHGINPVFCAGYQAFSFLAKVTHRNSSLLAAVSWLERAGCVSVASPPTAGASESDRFQPWRRKLFLDFLHSGRRDVSAAHECPYSEARLVTVRKAYRGLCTHGCAALVGAIVSGARFHVILGVDIEPCQWCGTQEIPSWDHLAWACTAFACTRCVQPEPLKEF